MLVRFGHVASVIEKHVNLDIRWKPHCFVPALKCEARVECEKITLRAVAIIKFVHPARVEIEMVVLT